MRGSFSKNAPRDGFVNCVGALSTNYSFRNVGKKALQGMIWIADRFGSQDLIFVNYFLVNLFKFKL